MGKKELNLINLELNTRKNNYLLLLILLLF